MGWLSSATGAVRNIFKGDPRDRAKESAPPDGLLIVKRGLSPAYYFFSGVFAKERGLEVVPDRRVDERRRWQRETPLDCRHLDRRRTATWPKEDFIVVRNPGATPTEPEPSFSPPTSSNPANFSLTLRAGKVDKVLETVAQTLIITSNLVKDSSGEVSRIRPRKKRPPVSARSTC